MSHTIVIAGATGLVGTELREYFSKRGDTVRVLSRSRSSDPNSFLWNPAAGELDPAALQGADVVINLAGESIASKRWTAARKVKLRESRVLSTKLLAEAAARQTPKPRLFISASGIGCYGDRGEEVLDEASSLGSGFLADLCRKWEGAAAPAAEAGIRTASLRISIVLSPRGGALAQMLIPFKLGLGAVLSPGDQFMSWITLPDLARAVDYMIGNESISGPVNFSTPSPVSSREFSRALAAALRRPLLFSAPAPALRLLVGGMADEALLASQRAVPKKLLDAGFTFAEPDLEKALRSMFAR